MLTMVILCCVIVLLSIAMMAVGYICQKKAIKGSCGGIAAWQNTQASLSDTNTTIECRQCGKPLTSESPCEQS
ncbi:MAG: (Na+)-NQR maturation NqrM [Proteobacteria bacterium]|nr:(Na+)-NQR maturation NqrM [Pseudomonadota bacterium]